MGWIRALRPAANITSALLVVVGFRFGNHSINWLAVMTVFFVSALAMLWNDYIDREADVAKGRILASQQPAQFLNFTLLIGGVALLFCLLLWWHNSVFGFLSLGMLASSIVYPFTQRNPLTKNSIVAITAGSTVLYPLLDGVAASSQWWLFSAVLLVISSRENIKDIEDVKADYGYKRTFALQIGTRSAGFLSGFTLVPACVSFAVAPLNYPWPLLLLLPASYMLMANKEVKLAKLWVDLGVLTLVLSSFLPGR
jgi:4-hydroxybenzoate polyprenyltransferase